MSFLRAHRVSVGPVPTGRLRVHRVSAAAQALSPTQPAYLRVHRVSAQALTPNRAPVVSIDKTTLTVDSGEDFVLTGFDSDPDGQVVSRRWTRGGVLVSSDPILRTRALPVVVDTTLTFVYSCTDDDGATTTASAVVKVIRAPIIAIEADGSLTGRVIRSFSAADIAAAAAGGGSLPTLSERLFTVPLTTAGHSEVTETRPTAGRTNITWVVASDQPFTASIETSTDGSTGWVTAGALESSNVIGNSSVATVARTISAPYVRCVVLCGANAMNRLTADLTMGA